MSFNCGIIMTGFECMVVFLDVLLVKVLSLERPRFTTGAFCANDADDDGDPDDGADDKVTDAESWECKWLAWLTTLVLLVVLAFMTIAGVER
jgi:hypothetical protein